MPSAAARYLESHQQTCQFSSKLNFISAQLIITFLPECLEPDNMALREASHHRCHSVTSNEDFDVLSVLHLTTFCVSPVEEH